MCGRAGSGYYSPQGEDGLSLKLRSMRHTEWLLGQGTEAVTPVNRTQPVPSWPSVHHLIGIQLPKVLQLQKFGSKGNISYFSKTFSGVDRNSGKLKEEGGSVG